MSSGLNILTDQEINRAIALKTSREVPLPAELSLLDGAQAKEYFEFVEFFSLYGLDNHVLVEKLVESKLLSGVAAAIGRHAGYENRLTHYAAFAGIEDPVKMFNATAALTDSTSIRRLVNTPQDGGEVGERAAYEGVQNRQPEADGRKPSVRLPFYRNPDGTFPTETPSQTTFTEIGEIEYEQEETEFDPDNI